MSKPIRTLIVDDEPPARKVLRKLLEKHPEVEVVGECGDVATGAALCGQLRPDLVFLDVGLPREDGFSLLPLLKEPVPIIFVTASGAHAVRAFEVNALDYLLKPIDPQRLSHALQRLPSTEKSNGGRLLEDDLVALREDSRLRMVPIKQITHIQAEDNYTRVILDGAPPAMVRRTLAEWEKILPEASFIRVDRSLIVRLGAIRQVKTATRDITEVTFLGVAAPLELGRTASIRLRKALETS